MRGRRLSSAGPVCSSMTIFFLLGLSAREPKKKKKTRTANRYILGYKRDLQSCAALALSALTTNFIRQRLPWSCRVSGHSRLSCGYCDPRRRAIQSAGRFWPPSRAGEGRCHCWPSSLSAVASSGRSCCCCCCRVLNHFIQATDALKMPSSDVESGLEVSRNSWVNVGADGGGYVEWVPKPVSSQTTLPTRACARAHTHAHTLIPFYIIAWISFFHIFQFLTELY